MPQPNPIRHADSPSDRPGDPDLPPGQARIPGREAILPLAFVALALLALAFAPVAMDWRTDAIRDEISEVVEPARLLVTGIEGVLAHEVSLTRGFLLTADATFLDRYVEARAQHRAMYDELRPLARRLGPIVLEHFGELRALTEQRHAAADALVRGETSPAEFALETPERQQAFERSLVMVDRLERAIVEIEREHRDRIARIRQVNRAITVGLVLLALLAGAVVFRVGHRIRRRTAEEIRLRGIARALTGAGTVDQVFERIAVEALALIRADGAYVERSEGPEEEVEIRATRGEGTPALHLRIPYPGSLSEDMVVAGVPVVLEDLGGIGESMAPYLDAACAGCSALVLPIGARDELIGALVLLRRPGRRSFGGSATELGSALADLASLAIRRVLLLEESEHQRDELAKLVSTRSRLIRGIGHDVKNPLGAADGYAELLEDGLKGELTPGQKEYIGRIRRMNRSILDIINNLLDFARAESGELHVQIEETDLNEIVRDTAEDYSGMADLADLELDVRSDAKLPTVRTDPVRVREIIGNLLSNAIKYTPAGGRVEVRTGVRSGGRAPGPGAWMTIDVEDTGPGIPAEERDRVFEEFHRAGAGDSEGAGIGLSISRSIVHMLGGDLSVRSDEGKGSTFTIWLPLSD